MRIITGEQAYANLKNGIKQKIFRIPGKFEPGCEHGILLPKLLPKFKLSQEEKIFTIGSCFAREIEALLINSNFNVPVRGFTVPKEEFIHPPPHLLNEYNVGTILQRIESVIQNFFYGDKGVEKVGEDKYIDLFLHMHQEPVTLNRLLARRKEIDNLYAQLINCDSVIITMGLTECWYDVQDQCYLNKAPSKKLATSNPERYQFHRMDVDDVLSRMARAIKLLNNISKKKILLTVSPVALEATFMENNAVMANSYSKAALRVVAELLKEQFDNIDYFPSYEIAMSAGLSGLWSDNLHVNQDLVKNITSHMLNYYCNNVPVEDSRKFGTTYVDQEFKSD